MTIITITEGDLQMQRDSQQVYPAIDPRPFKYKKSVLDFLCPLCGVERQFAKSYKLTKKNYLQIGILSVTLFLCFYPLLGVNGFIFVPVSFALFELWTRVSFRKDIPCPHCGFDASWYKRDVLKAREIVHEFWKNKNGTMPQKNEEEDVENQDDQEMAEENENN